MSTLTMFPGDLLIMDPSAKRVVLFDFDTLNLPAAVVLTGYTATITAIKQNGVTALTSDNAGLTGGNRQVQLRLLATTATLGDRYALEVVGITNENPAQEKPYSIEILVENT